MFLKSIFTAFFLLSQSSWAWPPTYGPEFEVGNHLLATFLPGRDNPSKTNVKVAQLEFKEKITERCLSAGCTVREVKGKWDIDYLVEYSDGWWFKVSYDPGCVEFTSKPATLDEYEANARRIDDHIFGTANMIGLTPKTRPTSHFNIGIRSAFGDDAKKFLRFFIDYSNHADLALGSLGYDLTNAPPLSVLKSSQRKALAKIVEDVNSGRMTELQDVIRAIQDNVYTHSFIEWLGSPFHYQAIGLKHAYKANLKEEDAPMEMRAIWIQKTAEEFILLGKFFEARINYLNQQTGPIIYNQITKVRFSADALKTRFEIYLEETGLKYKDFKNLLPADMRSRFNTAIFNPKSSPSVRLKDIYNYWDLIPVSTWIQNRVIELLSDTNPLQRTLRNQILSDLRVESGQNSPSFLQSVSAVFRPKPNEEAKKAFQDLLIRIEEKSSRSLKCPGVF